MTKAIELSRGWSVHAEWGEKEWSAPSMELQFRHRDGRRRNPLEFALVPEARDVYRDIKRQLDIMDKTRGIPMMEFKRAALERTWLALKLSLQKIERWSDDLQDTGIEAIANG